MGFEYDPDKSRANLEKHGVDFGEAKALWQDPDAIEIPARTEDELRFLVIGRIGTKLWSGIFTWRGENRRIISVRRSREEEANLYESYRAGQQV